MGLTNIKAKNQGFTIVELLIVVVVIAILAAITIVSYNGITTNANNSSAKSTATSLAKKVEAYASDPDTTGYPDTFSKLTAASASSKTYFVASGAATLDGTILSSSNKPTKPSEINFFKCGHTGSTTAPTATTITTYTGARIGSWNYNDGVLEYTDAGQVSGNGGATGTYPIQCFISAT
jgi:prepilin-type N-terminal cleavage/methylation domain-containing protein